MCVCDIVLINRQIHPLPTLNKMDHQPPTPHYCYCRSLILQSQRSPCAPASIPVMAVRASVIFPSGFTNLHWFKDHESMELHHPNSITLEIPSSKQSRGKGAMNLHISLPESMTTRVKVLYKALSSTCITSHNTPNMISIRKYHKPLPIPCAYPSTPSPQHRTRRPAPARCRRPPSQPSRSPRPAEGPGAERIGSAFFSQKSSK